MSNLEKYNNAFKEVFDLLESDLNQNIKMGESEKWDSLGHITLISRIEEEFDIMFESEDILEFQSFAQGIEILKKYNIDIS